MRSALIALLLAGAALQAQQPPTATTGQTLAWDQLAPDLATAQGYTYRFYLDTASTSTVLAPVTCVAKVPATPGIWDCSTPFPAVTPGPHTMTFTATNAAGESPKSAPFAFAFVAIPGSPENVRIR